MNKINKTKTGVLIALLVIFGFLLSGCSNAFAPSAEGVDVPDGFGKVDIRFTGEEAKTIFPVKNLFTYEYTFTRYEGSTTLEGPVVKVPEANNMFTLEVGNWRVAVKAFIGLNQVATGNAEFVIKSGEATQIEITLQEMPSSAGKGSLFYSVKFPSSASAAITMEKLPGPAPVALSPASSPIVGGVATRSQTLADLDSGFYLLTVIITKDGYSAGTNEVIHVYPHLRSNCELTFTEADFIAKTVTSGAIAGITAPVTGQVPNSAPIATTTEYTGSVSWSPADSPFLGNTVYTATITLAARDGYTFAGVAANSFTVAGAVATNAQNSGIIKAVFPATEIVNAPVSYRAIAGLTTPVYGSTPVSGSLTETDQYTASVSWSGFPANDYTATITLNAKTGYTFAGVGANTFTVNASAMNPTSVSNPAGSGSSMVVTAVYQKVTVTFNTHGGGTIAPISKFKGETISQPGDPNCSGFYFAGWFKNSNCDSDGQPLHRHKFDSAVTADMTIYARWLDTGYIRLTQENFLDYFWPHGGTNPNARYFLTEDIDLGAHLNNMWDNEFDDNNVHAGYNNVGWMPIGGVNEWTHFYGVFDGNGHEIRNLYMNRAYQKALGFFGQTMNAKIRNLGLKVADGYDFFGGSDVGILVGNAKNTLIQNCYVKGDVSSNGSVGAIAGHIGSNTILENCYAAEGNVTSLGRDGGGLVGNICDGATIKNCYSAMPVLGTSQIPSGIVSHITDRHIVDKILEVEYSGPVTISNNVVLSLELTGVNPGRVFCSIETGFKGYMDGPNYIPPNFWEYVISENNNGTTGLQNSAPITIANNLVISSLPELGSEVPNYVQRNGSSRSDSELKNQAAYVGIGWDFTANGSWKMPSGAGYPKLSWEND